MNRPHRSTIDICMKYLRRCLVAFGGKSYADTIISDDTALENTCDAIAKFMPAKLTPENWSTACDIYFRLQ